MNGFVSWDCCCVNCLKRRANSAYKFITLLLGDQSNLDKTRLSNGPTITARFGLFRVCLSLYFPTSSSFMVIFFENEQKSTLLNNFLLMTCFWKTFSMHWFPLAIPTGWKANFFGDFSPEDLIVRKVRLVQFNDVTRWRSAINNITLGGRGDATNTTFRNRSR